MWKGIVCVLVLACSAGAQAQTSRSVIDGYEDNIKSARTIGVLGPDLFGEEVNLKDGATSFRATDVSAKTNSGLPMAVGRVLGINARDIDQYTDYVNDGELFGNWKLDVPYMHGVFDQATGWISSMPSPQQRCSTSDQYSLAPPARASLLANGQNVFEAQKYWSGHQINIPGAGEENLLYLPADRTRPNDGRQYYGTTRSNWRVACIPSLLNGTGEGYLVILPDGTRYTFNWMSSRRVSALEDTACNRMGCTNGTGMYRREYFLHATRVEDRFGNWVAYQYDAANPRRLMSITSSDGVSVNLAYAGGKITSITTGSRTWQYLYADAARTSLAAVVQPDGSRWSFQYNNIQQAARSESRMIWRDCEPLLVDQSQPPTVGQSVTIVHPAGATGTFKFRKLNHGTDNTPGGCYDPDPDKFGDEQVTEIVAAYRIASLYEKSVTGPGLAPMTWSYLYAPSWSWSPNGYQPPDCNTWSCAARTQTDVSGPDGIVNRHVFGNDYWTNAGQLLETHVIQGGIVRRSAYTGYVTSTGGLPFPDRIGYDPNVRNNPLTSEKIRPQKARSLHQDGATFNSTVNTYDAYARPLSIAKWSGGMSANFGKTDVTEYHDDLSKWVLGQVRRQSNAETGIVMSQTDYEANALPWKTYSFGKLQQTLGYYADGSLATVTDGRGYTTTLSNWYRGIPRTIQHADGTSESASVDDNGWITSVVDENGYSTGYGYDAMGRVAGIAYPTGDSTAWIATTAVFEQISVDEYGIPAGHWRRLEQTGNARKLTYYDAMWRPIVEEVVDLANMGTTNSWVARRYDTSGRPSFVSYPRNLFQSGWVTWASVNDGTRTSYDAMDRVTRVEQDSELGVLVTSTEYLSGFQTRVTNPRGLQTTNGYQAYEQPSYDLLRWSVQPEGKVVDVFRHAQLGQPTQLRQRNTDGSLQQSRYFVYDGYRQLCKTIEPEVGSTVMAYDAAGNVAWTASGHALPDPANCNTAEGYGWGRRVDRSYDARNRLNALAFPDGMGNQTWTYTPDGLPQQIVTANDGGSQVINHYTYNRRRLLTGESLEQPGWYTWGIGYAYDANGNLSGQSYPTGLYIDYAPNALGQATRAGTYAQNVTYHPNGGIAQFTYGNGIVHTMTQNPRQLPGRSTDSGGVLDHEYQYDPSANVTYIGDLAQGSSYSRWMSYDGLDRLTAAGSASFGGDHWHRFTYDALDNMKSWKLAGVKDYANYYYEPGTNRLANIQNSAGATVVGLGYDVQGNLANKNGQAYSFDYGNRLRGVNGKEYYRYDGQGRRVLNWRPSIPLALSQYSLSGQVIHISDQSKSKSFDHIYLAGSLVAIREYSHANWAVQAVKFQHTDALGSPVAVSNEAAQVIDRTQYEPYGAAINKPAYDGVGYTGHVQDGATGLTYMQQRYYDPSIGRFLSVDPVTVNSGTGANFNRYWYANNNPYKFTDPDGRLACSGGNDRCREQLQDLERRGIPTWQAGGSSTKTKRQNKDSGVGYKNPTGKERRGCDGYGCGHNGARRDGGRRRHLGADYITAPGQTVVSPSDGRVERLSRPYANDPKYTGLLIRGADGNTLQIWYITPVTGIIGETVSQGQPIGVAQDLQEKYGAKMTNHAHLRITSPEGLNIDPATLIPDP